MSKQDEIKVMDDVWMKMVRRYSIAMLIGIVMLAYLFPSAHTGLSKPEMVAILFAGVLTFGGGFGIAVSLFFHLWHKK